jgi:hypothetical protein
MPGAGSCRKCLTQTGGCAARPLASAWSASIALTCCFVMSLPHIRHLRRYPGAVRHGRGAIILIYANRASTWLVTVQPAMTFPRKRLMGT